MLCPTVQNLEPVHTHVRIDLEAAIEKAHADLQMYFGSEFSLWEGEQGCLVRRAASLPSGDESLISALVPTVARSTSPQLIGYEDRAALLAVPLRAENAVSHVAVSAFAIGHFEPSDNVSSTATLLGLSCLATRQWINAQPVWTADSLLRLANAVLDKIAAEQQNQRLQRELDGVTSNLASTYEEISLLYDLTRNLRISSSEESLARVALSWLIECLPAESVAIQFLPVANEGDLATKARTQPVWLTRGSCPLNNAQFTELVNQLGLDAHSEPFVANRAVTSRQTWPADGIRQLVLTPLTENGNLYAWLAAFNHRTQGEFGTVEANLLNSVAVMLGIHTGNRELYRQQSEFLADVVRAMTSAIDAKDPYTCGHSDRVARLSVRLASRLGWSGERLTRIYMAGLLHDIGKIGIDERILRKPGNLTREEYNTVKRHPELGHRILVDIRQLSDVVSAVLHHHEQWDGGGYPHGLSGLDIPDIARVVAVADAYDAMTSDRPYRAGMAPERVDRIFREGKQQYWDPEIVEAYFAVKDDIIRISRQERSRPTLDVEQWS